MEGWVRVRREGGGWSHHLLCCGDTDRNRETGRSFLSVSVRLKGFDKRSIGDGGLFVYNSRRFYPSKWEDVGRAAHIMVGRK